MMEEDFFKRNCELEALPKSGNSAVGRLELATFWLIV